MGRRKNGAAPAATICKKTRRERVRIGDKSIWLGPAGSRQARDNYAKVLAAWGQNGGKLPADFKLPVERVTPAVPVPPPSKGMTVADILLRSMAEVGAGLSPKELRQVSRWWRLRSAASALEPYARLPAVEFGPLALQQIAKQLVVPKPNGQVRSRTQVREVIGEIRRIFKEAVAAEILPPERLVALQSASGSILKIDKARKRHRRQPVPAADIEATCAFLPAVVADLLRFIALTGCRPTEAMRATPEQFDTAQEPWVWEVPEHKTADLGVERVVAIGPRCRKILKRWWQGKTEDAYIFARGDLRRAGSTNVKQRKLRTDGERFQQTDLRQRVVRAAEKAGVDRWTPYRLRHTGLTAARKHGGLDAAQARGGQLDSRTVERHYAGPDIAKQAEFAEKFA